MCRCSRGSRRRSRGELPRRGRQEVKAMFAEVIEAFGTVDIFVNNAGLQQDAAFEEMSLEQWSSVHEAIPWAGHVNYTAGKGGVMLMTRSVAQEVAPHRIRVISGTPEFTAVEADGEGPAGAVSDFHLKENESLTFEPTGAIVAAPTTGLPEGVGG
ncbi:MAG: SDR family NAD(P)-dependent oxidoreductase [Spirochaetaceae bacterium]